MAWGVRAFAGMRPILPPHLLTEYQAQLVRNAWVRGGKLQAIPPPRDTGIAVASSTRTIYRYQPNEWFTWNMDVDVVSAPVVDDTSTRVYWSGDGPPKMTTEVILGAFISPNTPGTSGVVRNLGIPAPENGPTVDAQMQANVDADTATQFDSWVYTYVSDLSEEGAPSPASGVLERTFDDNGDIQSVTVMMDTGPTGPYNVVLKRIYRTVGGAGGLATFQFLAEVPVAQAVYTDSKLGTDLGEVIEVTNYEPPPDDLEGFINLPNGVIAGFTGRDVYFCEPYQGHAWPRDYVQVVPYDIVGLGSFGTNVVVLTRGPAVLLSGTHPDSYALSEDELGQPCVSKGSIARIGEQGVVYASPDGLVLVGPGGSRFLTKGTYDLEEWRALGPENARAVYHDQRYLMFLGTRALAFDPDTEDVYEFEVAVEAVFSDLAEDRIYTVISDSIQEFRTVPETGVANQTALWRSREWRGPEMSTPAFQVFGDATALRVYADGVLCGTATPADGAANWFQKVAGVSGLGVKWHFEIETTDEVTELLLGDRLEMRG